MKVLKKNKNCQMCSSKRLTTLNGSQNMPIEKQLELLEGTWIFWMIAFPQVVFQTRSERGNSAECF